MSRPLLASVRAEYHGPFDTCVLARPLAVQEVAAACKLQQWLRTFPGVFLAADGWSAQATSEAFHRVTGHDLLGDPRPS